ncbi:MAG: aminoacyl-tRNA hydrolase [Xanthobacteraceae bacterium]
MLLLAGLGNPGPRYAGNRHNIGFLAVDEIHRRHRFGPWRRRFHGETAEGQIGGERILLLKPMTFMNESGRAVAEAQNFFKIALGDVVVFHDEIDLAAAKVRVKTGGGNAGHNGLRSITAHCGNEYVRVRIGVGRPETKEQVHGHVLDDFAKDEFPWVDAVRDAIAEYAELLVGGRPEEFQNRVHLALRAKGINVSPPEPAT